MKLPRALPLLVILAVLIGACAAPPRVSRFSDEMMDSDHEPVGASAVHQVEMHMELDDHSDLEADHDDHAAVGDQEHEAVVDWTEGAPEIEIVATEWRFLPDIIALHMGEPVNLILVNNGSVVHDVSIPELDFHLHADPGETVSGTLTPNTIGEFEFACTIEAHYEAGMVGSIVVSG